MVWKLAHTNGIVRAGFAAIFHFEGGNYWLSFGNLRFGHSHPFDWKLCPLDHVVMCTHFSAAVDNYRAAGEGVKGIFCPRIGLLDALWAKFQNFCMRISDHSELIWTAICDEILIEI